MRDTQQKKAREYAFANIKENIAFWFRDFCQKVVPVKFRESQQDYYGKKGISIHVAVFLIKQQNLLKQHLYFTVIQRCEHRISDTLNLADVVYNAGSYHRNYCLEVLYNICKNKNIRFLRYDYNEPCCDKEQCNRESAGAKSLLRSFVDADNDMTTANDICKGLRYGFGLKNALVGVIEYDNSVSFKNTENKGQCTTGPTATTVQSSKQLTKKFWHMIQSIILKKSNFGPNLTI